MFKQLSVYYFRLSIAYKPEFSTFMTSRTEKIEASVAASQAV